MGMHGCSLKMIWRMIKKIPKVSDEQVQKTILQRISLQERGMQYDKELYCLDEAMDVLEETDKRLLLQNKNPDHVLANKHFSEKHRATAQMVKAKTQSAAAKRKP